MTRFWDANIMSMLSGSLIMEEDSSTVFQLPSIFSHKSSMPLKKNIQMFRSILMEELDVDQIYLNVLLLEPITCF